MFEKYVCPECDGAGSVAQNGINFVSDDDCWYCDGTGFASDEDTEEAIYRWED